MPRFDVTPEELEGAGSILGSVDATLNCPTVGAGDLGSPELEAAIAQFEAEAGKLSRAMATAVGAAASNVSAASYAYVVTDAGNMPGGP